MQTLPVAPEPSFWRRLLAPKMLVCLALGFTSGLPLWVVITLVQAWLRDAGTELSTLSLLAWTGTPYLFKFAWAPLLDRYVPPFLGRRRGWALPIQTLLLLTLGLFGVLDPRTDLVAIGALSVVVSFLSATQDITLDAWRREILTDEQIGFGNGLFVSSYRLASLIPGGLSLVLADHMPWDQVFGLTAAFMVVGLLTTLLAPEPEVEAPPPRTLREAVIEPFRDLFLRGGLAGAGILVAFVLLYKVGDTMATALVTAFYLDVGFTKTEIGTVAKFVGLAGSVLGASLGGVVVAKVGLNRALWILGVVQLLAIGGFVMLDQVGPATWALGVAVACEYFGSGLGTAAYLGYMQRETSLRFTGTQFALLSSIMALPRIVLASRAGAVAEAVGWTPYFLGCMALAVPGIVILRWAAPWDGEAKA